MEIYNPVKGITEEEYIEECRKRYRSKMDDTRFMVTARIDQIAKKFHPKDAQAQTQLKSALSRLIRSKFDVRTIHFIKNRAGYPDLLGRGGMLVNWSITMS